MAYTKELRDAVLKAADIVTVVSSYIPVIKKGKGYVALCPFHNDKHPSLQISPEKQIAHCFSCGGGGDAISFVQNYEKISHEEAIRKVAEIVGFQDPRLQSERRERRLNQDLVPLYKCINDLLAYYRYGLTTEEGKIAKEYLAKRHIDDAQVETFSLGYALRDGEKTIQYLQAKGHSLKSIEDIGIALAKVEGTSDSNAGRLIFPLFDHDGQVVGFSARRLADDNSAKYVNSPETRIFQKGKVLYNYHNAAKTARHDGYLYVLEGFMDVMALNKAGILSAVAVMGTALTDDHIALIKRLHCEIRLCLDGDGPGQEGMMRIANKLAKSGIPYRFVSNPGDLRDPDDILQEDGPEALKEAMSHLVDSFDFRLAYYANVKKLETVEDRQKVLRAFLPYLKEMPLGLERENAIARLAKVTQYEESVIRHQVEVYRAKEGDKKEEIEDSFFLPSQFSGRSYSRLESAERRTLYYMLAEMDAVRFFEEAIDSFYDDTYQVIANFIIAYVAERQEKVDLSILLNDIGQSGMEEADRYQRIITEIAMFENVPPYNREEIEECARSIREEKNKIHAEQSLQEQMLGKSKDEQAELIKRYALMKAAFKKKKTK